ncbi:RHS repeat-associated core domain-containing protein [Methylicorpusculum sp.]|uniref:golvesin C-terminal-like domain-containing protein n=1 Tax=Methylicorpusculum sp. TaxID=2713644 RepID=UPI002AB95BDF|nr:RHS repeat-associated core domain-containing protein [Methylicorpusculum sp.]MDZ4153041.1 RHS repeat-associated core domain-containing protein [Methylicorpusculum sp.]
MQCPKGYQPVGSNCLPDGKPKLEKNLGTAECGIGNPIIPNIANKIQAEIDYQHRGNPSLYLSRAYNSQGVGIIGWNGNGWSFNFDKLIRVLSSSVLLQREDGKRIFFSLVNGAWIPDSDVAITLLQIKDSNGATTGWTVRTETDGIEDYNSAGKLIRLIDRQGKSLDFSYQSGRLTEITDDFNGAALTLNYDASGRFAALTVPSGEVYRYGYDSYGNLTTVTYPDETPAILTDNPKKTYVYGELEYTAGVNQPHALTGIIDENGIRFATYRYDASGKAILTEHAGGVEKYSLAYSPDGISTTVTDPLGTERTTHFSTVLGVVKSTGTDQPGGSGCSAASSGISYDANGNVKSRTDFNGHRSDYEYDLSRNLEINRTEGLTSTGESTPDTRTITTEWHPSFRLPVKITEPGRIQVWTYDDKGQVTEHRITDTATGATRSWQTEYTYASDVPGAVLQKFENGPRTDVADITTYDYYAPDAGCEGGHVGCRGQLQQITNALGHVTRFSRYHANGQVEEIIDPNGLGTTLSYDARMRLTRIDRGGQVSSHQYDPAGQLIQWTVQDNVVLHYRYDDAHRLTAITDGAGNNLRYTLDASGNRVKEEVSDAGGQLTKILEREVDQLGRLMLSIGGEGQSRRYHYDANGNLTAASHPRNTPEDRGQARATDPLALDNTVSATYDSLNRLIESVHPQQLADANDDVVSDYRYDALGHLIEVTDPNGSVTRYDVNAFGEVLRLDSPDTGITHYQYDAAGNRIAQTDARGVTVEYRYDALNRLIAIDYPDDRLDVTFGYDQNDQGQNSVGRLTSISDGAGLTELSYDQYGNVISRSEQIDSHQLITHSAYNSAGQLVQMRYPSGRTVDFLYNALGQIAQLTTTLDGVTQTLADQIDYLPFGPLSALTYGNGLTKTIAYDLAYRPIERNLEPVALHTQDYDPADNLIVLTDLLDSNRDKTFAYDGLSRLTAAQSHDKRQEYSFDANSNRLTLSENGQAEDYTYALNGNRLEAGAGKTYQTDANGNIVHDGRFQFRYGDDNRLREVLENNVTVARYTYNVFSQRAKKVTAQSTTYYHYDQAGLLIAEADANGETLKEYFYLNGQPMALTSAQSSPPPQPVEIILDNSDASMQYSDAWTASTSISGFEGANYQYHAGSTVQPMLGTPVDNASAHFNTTDTWALSTSVSGFIGDNYQTHPGRSYPLVLGEPVDNDSPGFSATGTWPTSTSVKGYQGAHYQYHAPGDGSQKATWSLKVETAGEYDVYTTWTAHSNRARHARYRVSHSQGATEVSVNQKLNGGQWHKLGTFQFEAGTDYAIELNDAADGYVIADAVTWLPAGTPPTGTPNEPTQAANWTVTVPADSDYDAYATWTAHSNRASDAKYTIVHADGETVQEVNQQQHGGQWNKLGRYRFKAGESYQIKLSDQANGYVIADAVSLVPAGTYPISSNTGQTATWQPHLNQSADYQVYAKWTAHSNRASNAQYTVHHVNGETTHTVDQRQQGGDWHLLGTYRLDQHSTISLSDQADGYVIADAIRLVSVPTQQPTESQGIYFIHNDHLGTPQLLTDSDASVVWQADYDPYGDATITTAKIEQNIRFPGQYFDQETGLNYNWHRYYDPKTGRYITSDPIGLAGGVNTYAYVSNNPLNLIDPNGLAGIYVNYPNYPITVPGTEAQLPLGHAAVIAVDDNTGTTKYFEYGRYDSDFGQVKQRTVPDLVLDEKGNPTPASLSNLYNYIGARYGDQTTVDATYYPDANYQKIIDFALQRKNDSNRAPYSWNPFSSNTCKTFAKDAINAGQQK